MTEKMFEAPKWDRRYAADGYLFGTEPANFVRGHRDLYLSGQNALLVADGEGRNSVFVASQGLHVTTMDISEVGAAKARALAERRGVAIDVHIADVLEWDWRPDRYDIVLAVFIQFLTPQSRAEVFAGMVKTLRPGGRLLLHGYRPEQVEYGTGGPPTPETMYTEELLRESFAELEIEVLRSYDVEIAEGEGHQGMSALIDLVARKS